MIFNSPQSSNFETRRAQTYPIQCAAHNAGSATPVNDHNAGHKKTAYRAFSESRTTDSLDPLAVFRPVAISARTNDNHGLLPGGREGERVRRPAHQRRSGHRTYLTVSATFHAFSPFTFYGSLFPLRFFPILRMMIVVALPLLRIIVSSAGSQLPSIQLR